MQEIACPSDCVYLGGLSVVRDPAIGFTKDDYNAAFDRLRAFADNSSKQAVATFFEPGAQPAEWEMSVAMGYMLYGARDAAGQRLVDRFLAARGRTLPPQQVAALVALQHARASLYEVVSLQAGVGVELRDLLSGDTVHVRDVTASRLHKKWDVIFTWVVPFPDHHELTGAGCVIPREHLDRVRTAIDDAIAGARTPALSDRELVGVVAWAPIAALRAALRTVKMPTLETTDGESVQFCKAHYRVVDEVRVRERLDAELERDGLAYVWLDRKKKIVLGSVRIADDGLVLETMSRERNERGKRMLEMLLGELVVRGLDSIQGPESAPHTPRAREIPEDVERELLGKHLQDHYRQWPDDPLPALGGKTPRKAVRSRRGRAQVEALLKDIENGTIGMPGGDLVDFDGLRRELGLDDEAGYDANRAPDPAA